MKKPKSQPKKLNPITPEALVHIADLVECDNAGLEQHCARYRRRVAVRRYAVAACLFVVFCFPYASLLVAPTYEQITTSGKGDIQHICNTVDILI